MCVPALQGSTSNPDDDVWLCDMAQVRGKVGSEHDCSPAGLGVALSPGRTFLATSASQDHVMAPLLASPLLTWHPLLMPAMNAVLCG